MINHLKIFLTLLIFSGSHSCYAGDSLSGKYPRAILVQLRSEHNRLAAMARARDANAMEEVTQDAIEVRKRIKNDFTDHFHYCPVYYYMDTNADLVKKKAFEGVLMNVDGSPVIKPVVNSNSDDYFIAYYGYFITQPRINSVITDPDKYISDPEARPGKGLVILNDKFLQIDYFYKYDYDGLVFKLGKRNKKYYYLSKHYDIEYYPFANLFEQNMYDRYARRRINPGLDELR